MTTDDEGPLLPGATATYSPEDNKLRLYPLSRLSRELYEQVKAAGFQWAPKQELFVAPGWTPGREDLLVELVGEVGDEDYSPLERSADRAERFGGYRDKRRTEAHGHADTFESGPAAFGHQNRERAERQAMRHDRHRGRALSQWGKAEYWQQRTEGVISHALYKSSAPVRRSRIKRLEAEQRKHETSRKDYAASFSLWSKVTAMEGADRPGRIVDGRNFDPASLTPALKLAYTLANSSGCGVWDYTHPRTGAARSLYSHLTDEADPITPAEAAALWLKGKRSPDDPESHSARWSDHYANRLTYEKAMLAAEGGTAAAVEMEPGGFIRAGRRTGSVFTDVPGGEMQIHAVNRSPATGQVVSVKVMGNIGYRDPRPGLVSINIERLGEGAYRAPTDEERAAFAEATKKRKAEEKAQKKPEPPTINPTDDDAERLQAFWNAAYIEKLKKSSPWATPQPSEVLRISQADYSKMSKGSYSSFEIRTIHADGRPARRSSNMWTSEGAKYDSSLPAAVFKVRLRSNGFCPDVVVVLTDKPQKPLPLDWPKVEGIAEATR